MENANTAPNSKVFTVHKTGEEGAILIDRQTGIVKTPVDQRPDWADGLACAMLAERQTYYQQRLGPSFSDKHAVPDSGVLVFEDLAWIAVDDEGNEAELDASGEYRMDIVAEVLGIDRDADAADAFGDTVAEVEVARDYVRTGQSAALVDEQMSRTFGQDEAAAEEQEAQG